ncbi:MAG: hypothetical protein RLZZ546_616 [Bacteroidota bacterium]|jgi:hypothetical protein
MNKNLLIIGGIALAAVLGYFSRGIIGGGADLSWDYADCMRDCEQAHTTTITSILQEYDSCMDAANDASVTCWKECLDGPCGSAPHKPPCQTCISRCNTERGEAIQKCRTARNTALAAENEKYRKCKGVCNNMISFKEN